MRELKFRAWDMEQKEMFFDYPGWFATAKIGKDTNLMTMDMERCAIGFDGGLYALDECGNYEGLNPERYILMQYTGLHDKNGKEVYEGDICNTPSDIRGWIEWHNDRFTWTDGACHWNMICDRDDGPNDDDIEKVFDLEVIGNIYENPELVP